MSPWLSVGNQTSPRIALLLRQRRCSIRLNVALTSQTLDVASSANLRRHCCSACRALWPAASPRRRTATLCVHVDKANDHDGERAQYRSLSQNIAVDHVESPTLEITPFTTETKQRPETEFLCQQANCAVSCATSSSDE